MAYAVSIGSGYSKLTVRFPTAAAALKKAQDEADHGAEDVTLTVSSTQERLSLEEFKARMASGQLETR